MKLFLIRSQFLLELGLTLLPLSPPPPRVPCIFTFLV